MQKFSLSCTAGLLVLLVAGLYSCKKVNGIDNNQVIQTPYSLYFSDSAGTLYNSTDGINKTILASADGYPCRAICTAGPNILWAKDNLYISVNNGQNFNHTYDSLRSLPDLTCNNLPLNLNQTMLISIPAWNRVYAVSAADPGDGVGTNYLGLVHNDANGVRGYWYLDEYYDTLRVGYLNNITMASLTQLANGILCGLAYDRDNPQYARNFYKTCKDDATCRWKEVTANPDAIFNLPSYNISGTPLPGGSSGVPGYYSLGHFNNRLIAIDSKCTNGAWYSDDTGKNWAQCQGLPVNTPLLCIAAPFEERCLIGTDSAGLYTYNANTDRFEQNNNGLSKNLKIRSITFKENDFKNSTSQRYVYLATDQGIYQSTDGGYNWVKTIPGNFVAIY